MQTAEILVAVNYNFSLQAVEVDMIQLLEQKINFLILHDFNKLISILYRADVHEGKLAQLLAQHKREDAGKLIAALFIQRQMEKMATRHANRTQHPPDSEEEYW